MGEVSRKRRCVLVVEDDHDIRSSLEMALGDEGYDVVTASNGQDALDCLRCTAVLPFVILLDMRMPVMDGRMFLAARTREPALADIPVIVLTADGSSRYVPGATLVMTKPFGLDALLDELIRLR
jgi:CheY-like chemotaxis protein